MIPLMLEHERKDLDGWGRKEENGAGVTILH